MDAWVVLLFSITILYIIITGRAETSARLLVAMVDALTSGALLDVTQPKEVTPGQTLPGHQA